MMWLECRGTERGDTQCDVGWNVGVLKEETHSVMWLECRGTERGDTQCDVAGM